MNNAYCPYYRKAASLIITMGVPTNGEWSSHDIAKKHNKVLT